MNPENLSPVILYQSHILKFNLADADAINRTLAQWGSRGYRIAHKPDILPAMVTGPNGQPVNGYVVVVVLELAVPADVAQFLQNLAQDAASTAAQQQAPQQQPPQQAPQQQPPQQPPNGAPPAIQTNGYAPPPGTPL